MGSSVDYTIIYSKESVQVRYRGFAFFMAPCLQRLKDYAHTALLSYLRGMIHNARSLMSACVASRRALDPSRLRRCGASLKPRASSDITGAPTPPCFYTRQHRNSGRLRRARPLPMI